MLKVHGSPALRRGRLHRASTWLRSSALACCERSTDASTARNRCCRAELSSKLFRIVYALWAYDMNATVKVASKLRSTYNMEPSTKPPTASLCRQELLNLCRHPAKTLGLAVIGCGRRRHSIRSFLLLAGGWCCDTAAETMLVVPFFVGVGTGSCLQ